MAFIANYGNAANRTSGTELLIFAPFNNSVRDGDLVVAVVVCDNYASTSAPTITLSAEYLGTPIGETWTQIGSTLGSGVTTTAGAGTWTAVFVCRFTSNVQLINGTTWLKITLSNAVVAKAAGTWVFDNTTIAQRGTLGTGTSASGAPSASTSGTALVADDLVIGVVGGEDNALPTGDADTTNGSWSTIDGTASSGGGAASNVTAGFQYKYVTGTGAQTYNPTTANDSAAVVFSLIPATIQSGDATLTVSATAESDGFDTQFQTATDTPASTTPAGAGASTKPLVATATNVAPTPTAAGFVTEFGTASLTITSTPAAAGVRTRFSSATAVTVTPTATAAGARTKTATFELWESGSFVVSLGTHTVADNGTVVSLDLTPHVGSLSDNTGSGIEIRMTASSAVQVDAAEWESWHVSAGVIEHTGDASLTITPTTVTTGFVTSSRTAATTITPTTTAAGFATEFGTINLTISPTPASAGFVTDFGTAALTVTPIPVAAGFKTLLGNTAVTVTPSTTAAGTAFKSATAVNTSVSPTTTATPGAATKSTTASVTATPATASAGFVNDEGVAALTITPTTAAAGSVTDLGTASLTVSPIPAATGALSTSQTASSVVVSPASTASGTVDKSTTADVTTSPSTAAAMGDKSISGAVTLIISPTPAATAITWRTQFMRPDAILSMSGLTGSYTDIQDSPNSPGVTELSPTGGAVDVRFSFENHTQQLRTQTGDQKIRVLVTTP